MSGKTCKGESEPNEEGKELVKPWPLMAKETASPALIPVGQWLWAFPGASLPWAKRPPSVEGSSLKEGQPGTGSS